MKIYELRYRCESKADGYNREYFTSRRATEKGLAQLKREHAAETKAAEAQREAGELYAVFPIYYPDEAKIDVLEFTGTAREMVLRALRLGNR
jgi:hypothetical protein